MIIGDYTGENGDKMVVSNNAGTPIEINHMRVPLLKENFIHGGWTVGNPGKNGRNGGF